MHFSLACWPARLLHASKKLPQAHCLLETQAHTSKQHRKQRITLGCQALHARAGASQQPPQSHRCPDAPGDPAALVLLLLHRVKAVQGVVPAGLPRYCASPQTVVNWLMAFSLEQAEARCAKHTAGPSVQNRGSTGRGRAWRRRRGAGSPRVPAAPMQAGRLVVPRGRCSKGQQTGCQPRWPLQQRGAQ